MSNQPTVPFVSNPVSPWHMWGSHQRIVVTAAGGAGPGTVLFPDPKQLFKTNYRRPDTWSFFFFAQVLGGLVSDVQIDVIVNFNIMIGVGRTMFDTAGVFGSSTAFAEMRFRVVAGTQPALRKKWTTQVNSPPLDDTAIATSVHPIEWVPAEDLQCLCRAAMVLGGVTAVDNRIDLEVGAWCAPRSHIRPDWFSQAMTEEEAAAIHATQFTGNERGGT